MHNTIVFKDLDHYVAYLFLLEKYESKGFRRSDKLQTVVRDGKVMIVEVSDGK